MSPFGTKRTSDNVRLMSAKRAKADIDRPLSSFAVLRPPRHFLEYCLLIRFHARRNLAGTLDLAATGESPWQRRHGTRTTLSAFCTCSDSAAREIIMHSKSLAIASALVVMLAGTTAWAQSGTSEKTPGHIMQRTPQSKSTGPGASEYAPGHLKKRKSGSESASGFTPSHRTTPSTTGVRTR
jgi:hypothetical protein